MLFGVTIKGGLSLSCLEQGSTKEPQAIWKKKQTLGNV